MNPFLRYLADKNSAHRQTDTHTDRQTDRHTPMITIPCGLRRAGNKPSKYCLHSIKYCSHHYHAKELPNS